MRISCMYIMKCDHIYPHFPLQLPHIHLHSLPPTLYPFLYNLQNPVSTAHMCTTMGPNLPVTIFWKEWFYPFPPTVHYQFCLSKGSNLEIIYPLYAGIFVGLIFSKSFAGTTAAVSLDFNTQVMTRRHNFSTSLRSYILCLLLLLLLRYSLRLGGDEFIMHISFRFNI